MHTCIFNCISMKLYLLEAFFVAFPFVLLYMIHFLLGAFQYKCCCIISCKEGRLTELFRSKPNLVGYFLTTIRLTLC